jgi:hypothetical protein
MSAGQAAAIATLTIKSPHSCLSSSRHRALGEMGCVVAVPGPSVDGCSAGQGRFRKASHNTCESLRELMPAALAAFGCGLPVIASEHVIPGKVGVGPRVLRGDRRFFFGGGSRRARPSMPPGFPTRPQANADRLGRAHSHVRPKSRKRARECGFRGSDPC